MLTKPALQNLQTRSPGPHLVNRDIPTHTQLNDQTDQRSHQLRLQY
ncbi:hypothetical protein [Streptomyces lonarensis]|nr:hypothetical protein [Streptomyces lonarensis]